MTEQLLPESKERRQRNGVGVYNELDVLKRVVIWGEPGCEALLGQLIDQEESLFLNWYSVPEARKEFVKMEKDISEDNVSVLRFKDTYVEMLMHREMPGLPETIFELSEMIKKRGMELFKKYEQSLIRQAEKEGREPINPEDVLALVEGILEEDEKKYGTEEAIRLNYELSIKPELPLANIFYARDQSNTLGDYIVLSRMKWPIRKLEVPIFADIYKYLGYRDNLVYLNEGTFEGGDAMIIDGNLLVGVGARTSKDAFLDLYSKIGTSLKESGIEMYAICNEKHAEEAKFAEKPSDEGMKRMHLDIFFTALSSDKSLGHGGELQDRKVLKPELINGGIELVDRGSFDEFLKYKMEMENSSIDDREQVNYATNLLIKGNGILVVPLSENGRVLSLIQGLGFSLRIPEIKELTGGYGAVHCMIAPIKRG